MSLLGEVAQQELSEIFLYEKDKGMDDVKRTCICCGNREEDSKLLHEVLISQPDGEQQHLAVCENRLPLFEEKREVLFKVLGGSTYSEENRPPFWHNDMPLHYAHFHITYGQLPIVASMYGADSVRAYPLDTRQLPLKKFPLIEDFEVILQRSIAKNQPEGTPGEYDVFFFSPSRGHLAHFLMGRYTIYELRQQDFVIPIGDFATPYLEFDWGWALLLAADGEFVYVLTRVGEEEAYQTWFKVERNRYYDQWERPSCSVVRQTMHY